MLEVEPETGGAKDYRDRRPKTTPERVRAPGGLGAVASRVVRRGAIALGLVALLLAALAGCESDSGGNGSSGGAGKPASVTVVAQNLLHGIACPADTERCKLPNRVQLFGRQLEEAKCPPVVSVEEVDPVMRDLLRDQAKTICSGGYTMVTDDDPSIDREVVLTTLPVIGQERVRLAGPLRTALWVRLRAPVGSLDIVATHLASDSDDRPCDRSTCPPPCEPTDTLNTCQGRQAAELLSERASPEGVGVLMGDLNAKPGDPTIAAIEAKGFVDTNLSAGNTECDAATGDGCTSGREDADLSDMTNPRAKQQERIDYVFLRTRRDCDVAKPTGRFAAAPANPPLEGLVFASDHTGVTATISCTTTKADLAAARPARGRFEHDHDAGRRGRRRDCGRGHEGVRDRVQRWRADRHPPPGVAGRRRAAGLVRRRATRTRH